jgi:hypothetical protein
MLDLGSAIEFEIAIDRELRREAAHVETTSAWP